MSQGFATGDFATSAGGRYPILTALKHSSLPSYVGIVLSATDDRRLRVDAAVSSIVPATMTAAVIPATGFLAFGAIGAAYADVLDPGGNYVEVALLNSTNVVVIVSLDNGVTDHYRIPAGGVIFIDADANDRFITNSKIRAKHAGVVATRGEISATVIR